MLCAGILSFIVVSLASVPVCLADVSLIVPGFDPQPLSVDIVGVGADGETTYQLVPGQATGTWVDWQAFAGTVTLIEGATNAVLEYANSAESLTVIESCTLATASGMAGCMDVYPGIETILADVTATPILVQGGGTASPGPTSAASSSVSAQTATPAPGSSVSGSAAATSSVPSSSITPSKSASSGIRLTPVKVAGLAGMLAMWTVLA